MNDSTRRELVALLPRMRRFAYGLTGSLEEGDDLLQSACERALARLHQWQPGTRLDSWMYRIVQTIWIDRLRSQRGRPRADPELLAKLEGGDAEREMEARLELAKVRQMIARLPEEQRLVLMLVTVEGLSYKDAAATIGIPIGTVMSRLARARLELGRMLTHAPSAPRSGQQIPQRSSLRIVE